MPQFRVNDWVRVIKAVPSYAKEGTVGIVDEIRRSVIWPVGVTFYRLDKTSYKRVFSANELEPYIPGENKDV